MLTGLDMSRVRVVKPYVGGGFGPKAEATPLDILAAFLSLATGQPVKMAYTREQVFLHGRARHQFVHQMTTGAKSDGTLVALDHACTLDGGAYSSFGIATVYYAGSLLGGPYKLGHMRYHGRRVYTNKPACGAQRGHGGVVARALFERQLDLIARELGLDPVELRLRNVMAAGDVTCNDLNMSSLGMRECIEAVREGSGWDDKRGRLPRGKGIGMACGFFVSGAGYPIYRSETFHCTVTVKLDEDGGGALVQTASAEIGQGSDTTMAMFAAEALGIPLDRVRVVSGDTELGIDLGAYSSRTTLMTGHATTRAAAQALDQVLAAVAEELGVERKRLSVSRGKVRIRGGGVDIQPLRTRYLKEHRGWDGLPAGEELTFAEAARVAYLKLGTIVGTGAYRPPALGGKYKGAAVGTSPAYGCSAQVAEVSVDLETGQVFVERITDAHDCGRAVNLTSVEGQMEGSVSMGLGEALMEEVKFDPAGRVVNASLGEYHLPTILDMPEMKCIVVESDEPNGPYGAKEVGEGAIMPTIPAILNAVKEATGAEIDELPLTPERVLAAIRAAAKG
jgi:4-hydroxybenzoyl-CoA reductase subunit alpha